MKGILFIVLLLTGALHAQTIIYPGYTSYWNPVTLIPDSVIWIAKPHVKVVGRASGFHATGNRPNETRDYRHSGYDIGHNCDASDENRNVTDEFNSFDYANTFPQRPNNNRLVWLALENDTRNLATQFGSVRVKVYWQDTIGTLGPDRIYIPNTPSKKSGLLINMKNMWCPTLIPLVINLILFML